MASPKVLEGAQSTGQTSPGGVATELARQKRVVSLRIEQLRGDGVGPIYDL